MVSFLAASAAIHAGLRSTQVFGAREFVAGVVDHFIRTHLRCGVGTEAIYLPRKNGNHKQQKRLQQQ
jgi:hypothetical protein